MAKLAGLGIERLVVDGNDVSGNVGALQSVQAGRALLDYTDLTQAAIDRRQGLADGKLQFNSWWDGTPSTGVNELFKTLRVGAHAAYCIGLGLGSPCACMVCDQADYSIPRTPEGSLAATIDLQASRGSPLEWGVLLTAGSGVPYQTFGAAGNGSDVDELGGAPTSTAFGAILYVQLLAFAGTSVTVKVQDAATLPTYADVTGLTTTAMSAKGAQRVATPSPTATIRRYTRIVTTGTFSNAVILAALVRPISAQA